MWTLDTSVWMGKASLPQKQYDLPLTANVRHKQLVAIGVYFRPFLHSFQSCAEGVI